MRRRRQYGSEDIYRKSMYKQILLEEFLFHNRIRKVIDEEIIISIKNRMKENEKIYWTNNIFASKNIGFCFFIKNIKIGEEIRKNYYISLVELSFPFEINEFNQSKLIYGGMFITFDMDEEQKEFLLNLELGEDYEHDYKTYTPNHSYIINDWQDLIGHLIKHDLIRRYNTNDNEWQEFIKDYRILFNKEVEKKEYVVYDRSYSRLCYHIIDVTEKRIDNINYRVALVAGVGRYTIEYSFITFKETDEEYNYIDKNRLYILKERKYYFFDMITNEYNEDNNPIIYCRLIENITRNIEQILGNKQFVINAQIYRFYKERYTSFDSDEHITTKEKLLIEQYINIIKTKGTVKIDNIIITKNKIEVLGEIFKIEFGEEFLDVISCFPQIRKAMRVGDIKYNFNYLYENILKLSKLQIIRTEYTKEHEYKTFNEIKYKLNGMDVSISKAGNKININGIFCRIEDVQHILSKLICYNNIDEFNRYVKDVSYIGVAWKIMISNGVAIELYNPLDDLYKKANVQPIGTLYMRFSLLWDAEQRSRVYLLLNEKTYLIRYKGKFKQYFNYPNKTTTIESLKNELIECLEYIDDENILEIVQNAVEEAKIIKQRGEELVKNTIQDIQAKEEEIDLRGTKVTGYTFKGRVTGSVYFVSKVTLEVYRKDGMVWNRRCVVDDHNKQRIFEDRLANRLVNIFNEPVFISTLHN